MFFGVGERREELTPANEPALLSLVRDLMLYRHPLASDEGQGTQTLRVDSNGHKETQLVPGDYDVLVGAPSLAPSCKRFEILAGRAVKFAPKLKPDFENMLRE